MTKRRLMRCPWVPIHLRTGSRHRAVPFTEGERGSRAAVPATSVTLTRYIASHGPAFVHPDTTAESGCLGSGRPALRDVSPLPPAARGHPIQRHLAAQGVGLLVERRVAPAGQHLHEHREQLD